MKVLRLHADAVLIAVELWCFDRYKIVYSTKIIRRTIRLNRRIPSYPPVCEKRGGGQEKAAAAQVVFAFARAVGMLPLTETSSVEHMKQDLASSELNLGADAVQAIESVAG